MWYVRPAKPQISLRIRAVWSEPLLVAWVFYDCKATDWTPFGVSKLKRRVQRLVRVYTCQNATLLEISWTGSFHWFISGHADSGRALQQIMIIMIQSMEDIFTYLQIVRKQLQHCDFSEGVRTPCPPLWIRACNYIFILLTTIYRPTLACRVFFQYDWIIVVNYMICWCN